jgi:hypothetical protein
MFKKVGALLVTVLGFLLLAYSATRSLDFISLTLPPDRQIMAYVALAALDGGLVAWLVSFMFGSRGWQRVISILMVVIDLAGVIVMFTADTVYNSGKAGLIQALTADEILTTILALSAIIGMNIAATIAHHLTDPERLREMAQEDAFSKIEDAALKQISQNAEQLAAQLAPTLAADWMANTRARYMAGIGTGKVPMLDLTTQDVDKPPAPAAPIFRLPAWLNLWSNGSEKNRYNATVSQVPAPIPTEAPKDGPADPTQPHEGE